MHPLVFKIILFINLCVLISTSSIAQQDVLEQKISVNYKNQPLGLVIDKISSDYKINFTYNNNLFPGDITVSIKMKNKKLHEVFDRLFTNTGIEYLVVENQIIFRKAENSNISGKKKNFTIRGYIRDKKTGESLFGSSIYVKELLAGTTSNAYGFYSITLPEGIYQITYSFIGYKDIIININLDKDIYLSQEIEWNNEKLKEVVIESDEPDKIINETQMSEIKLSPKTIKQIPSYMGEAEVIKSLQSLPGVKVYGDGSTYYYVRGGERDQNLILIDEAPVYNPSHLLGFFSSFIPGAIKSVDIYKGDFPVQYGDRLSSIMDIRTKEGNLNNLDGNVSLGAFISRISLDGPIIKEKSSFFISYRRSNLNWLFFDEEGQKISFSDINSKINFKIGKKDRLFYSGYFGTDLFRKFVSGSGSYGITWNNFTNSLRWNHIFSKKLFSNTTVFSSTYDYSLIMKKDTNFWHANISTLSIKSDFTYYINPSINTKFGYQFSFYGLTPGELIMENFNSSQVGYPSSFNKYAHELAIYLGNDHKLSDKLSARYGLRFSSWNNIGPGTEYIINTNYYPTDTINYMSGTSYNSYNNIEPRLSINYILNNHSSIKAGYSHGTQYLQVLTNSISPFTSLEIWFPSGPNILPQKAKHYALGYFTTIKKNSATISCETFYKTLSNQIDYKDHANMLLNPIIETELRFGKAWSYGVELLVKKDIGKLSGSVGYNYSRAFKQIKDINGDKAFPAFFDRPHEASIFIAYEFSKIFHFSANWVYSTGSTISVPTGFFYYQNQPIPIYGDKNNSRLPDYHRLDVMVTCYLNPESSHLFNHNLALTLYNVYWRKNYYTIYYNKTELSDGSIVIPSDHLQDYNYIPVSRYLLGLIPSLTYNLNF
ncbi:MAG: TonB-dependent receptor [Bacteroidota bacterium]